jgi:hypothetical protein
MAKMLARLGMIPCNLLVIISVTTNGEVMIIPLDIIHVPPVSRKISQQSRPKGFYTAT